MYLETRGFKMTEFIRYATNAVEDIQTFKEFRKKGEHLKYLGVDMIVLNHYHDHYFYSGDFIRQAVLRCEYFGNGEFKIKEFGISMLPFLIEENQ